MAARTRFGWITALGLAANLASGCGPEGYHTITVTEKDLAEMNAPHPQLPAFPKGWAAGPQVIGKGGSPPRFGGPNAPTTRPRPAPRRN